MDPEVYLHIGVKMVIVDLVSSYRAKFANYSSSTLLLSLAAVSVYPTLLALNGLGIGFY